MRITLDNGSGSTTGRWLSLHFGPGKGCMRKVWTRRNRRARRPRRGRSAVTRGSITATAFCTRWFCQLPGTRLGRFLLCGHTLRVWCGPTYYRGFRRWLHDVRVGAHSLRLKRQCRAVDDGLYSLVSWR